MKTKKYSLYTIIGIVLVSSISFAMIILFTYEYFYLKNSLTKSLQENVKTTTIRLQQSVVPFINSYSVNEYEKLLENEFSNQSINAIVLHDYKTSKLIGKDFITGKMRDQQRKIKEYAIQSKILLDKEFFYKRNITSNGVVIGTIEVYGSDKLLIKSLQERIITSILLLLTISIISILFILFLLKKSVIQPIHTIIEVVSNKDKNGLPWQKIPLIGSKETSLLAKTLQNMITQIKRSKKEILLLNDRYQLTLDALDEGIWDWDLKLGKVYYSKQWKSMLGFDENDIGDSPEEFFNLVHEDDKSRLDTMLVNHMKDPINNIFNAEFKCKCKDGKYKWIKTRGRVYLDEKNKPLRMLGSHSDITKEKETQEYLELQNKIVSEQSKNAALGEMVANIAHQWRQPLSLISVTSTGMLFENEMGQLQLDDKNVQNLEKMNEQAQYLSQTIDTFRNFLSEKKELKMVVLQDQIKKGLDIIQASLRLNHIQMESNLDTLEPLEYQLVVGELTQVIINIVNNAKDVLKELDTEEKWIKLLLEKQSEKIVISIEDNGGGIKEEIAAKIFEPYFTTKHKSQGTGLGLYMSYKIVTESLKGKLYVKNSENGAKFFIELPIIL